MEKVYTFSCFLQCQDLTTDCVHVWSLFIINMCMNACVKEWRSLTVIILLLSYWLSTPIHHKANSVFFSPSYCYGNSRPADTLVLTVYITGPMWPFPGFSSTLHMESWEQCTVIPNLPPPSLPQQIFTPLINYSGWEVNDSSLRV